MFNRIAIFGLVLFVITAGPVPAASNFPKTAEDYALVYEMQLYQQLKGNSAEFRRRIKIAKQVVKAYKKSGANKANEPIAIQWFQMASRSGGALPSVPSFAKNAKSRSVAAPTQVQPESDWGQRAATPATAPPAQAEPADDGDLADLADLEFDDVADATSDAWSASEIDEAFGAKSPTSGANESLVTSDPGSTSVLKKSTSAVTKGAADMASDLAAKVWGDTPDTPQSNDLAALGSGSSEATPPVESLPTFSINDTEEATAGVSSSASDGGDGLADVWGETIESANAKEGLKIPFPGTGGSLGGASLKGGMAPMALMGAGFLTGIISLFCWIKQLIVAFKNSALLGIISLVTCGLGGLIIGWIKHKEWGLTKTMKVWTGCTILGIIFQMAAGFFTAMG